MIPNLPALAGLEPYLSKLASIPPFAPEEAPLFEAAAAGCPDACERVFLGHLHRVVKIACQYSGYGLPLADLVSEGNLGLLRASELYNPALGVEFGTYAGVWIKQRIHRAITAQGRAVRIPVWRSQRLRRLDRLHAELNAELGGEENLSELADRLGLEEERLAEIEADRVRVASLDADPEAAARVAAWEDTSTLSPGEHLSRRELQEEIAACLHGLDDTELQVVTLKFGLLDDEPESYREMAPRFGKSREWIRRVGEKALAKVAHSLESVGNLPRAIVRARKEKAQARLVALARQKAALGARLSLFQTVLMERADLFIP